MPVKTDCPSPGELLQFVLGLLPAGEVDRLAEHVESCDDCEAGLRTLRARDGLLDEVRRCGGGADEPSPGVVQDLIERFTGPGPIDEAARRGFEAAWRAGRPRPI